METLSFIMVILGILSALIIFMDIRYNPQQMRIMNTVWVLTGLWGSFLALIAYYWFGREVNNASIPDNKDIEQMQKQEVWRSDKQSKNMPQMESGKMEMEDMHMSNMGSKMDESQMHNMGNMNMGNMSSMNNMQMGGMTMGGMKMAKHKKWQSVALSALHCGAGCSLADIIGAIFISIIPIYIFGYVIFGSWAISYGLALMIGIYFQYLAIKEMQPKMKATDAIKKAAKADVLSLTSWQIGMYGWSAIMGFAILKGEFYSANSWSFWFSMQIAMVFGFITAYPMNILLIKWGLKKGM